MLDRLFMRHCREQDESYLEHARFAGSVGARMALGGLACMVHAVLPGLFTTTGSRTVYALAARLGSARPGGRACSRDPDDGSASAPG